MKKLFLVILSALLISSCSKDSKETNTTKSSNIQQSQSSISDYVKTDFYFKLPSKNGKKIDLSIYKDKPVMVMFFTENCPYCIKASGFIESIHKKYGHKGLEVIGISTRRTEESVIEFEKITGVKFQLAYDGIETARNYGISGVPFIYLLDKKHNLYKVWAGYDKQYDKNIEESVSKILGI